MIFLKRKILPSCKFLKFVYQVTIQFWFRKAFTLKLFEPNIKFENQFIVSAIKFRKWLSKFMYFDSPAGEVWLLNISFALRSPQRTSFYYFIILLLFYMFRIPSTTTYSPTILYLSPNLHYTFTNLNSTRMCSEP